MTFEIQVESLVVTVKIVHKKHIKHCYLRVLQKNLLEFKANKYFTKSDALKIIDNKKTWIIKQIKKLEKNSLKDNEFLFLGEKREASSDFDVDKFYKDQIKKLLPPILEKYSKQMNLFPNEIKYRKNKRTWGSCNYKNDLNFNINLCKFPIEVMEYVVIHELAHIEFKNHSKNFWNLVEVYCPDYKQREKLLKSFL